MNTPILSRNPAHSFNRLLRAFDEQFGGPDLFARSDRPGSPEVRLNETDEDYTLDADLPGVKPEDIDVQIDRETVRIKASSTETNATDGETLRREFRQRNWDFAYRLGGPIEADNAEAVIEDGVLRLRIPKSETARPRKIDVTSAPALEDAGDESEDGNDNA
jgi:HSP20 family protein